MQVLNLQNYLWYNDLMNKILIYSTPTCPWCKKVKAYLTEKGFEYKDINVVEDPKAQEEMIDKSGQLGVPVIDIDGKIIIGFDKEKIDQILSIKN